MTDDLRAQAQLLVDARAEARLADDAYRERLQEPDIATLAQAKRETAELAASIDADVRAGIERAWLAADLEGEEPKLPAGLGIQWRQELDYDERKAIDWVLAQKPYPLLHLLRLDRKGFESLVKHLYRGQVPFVTASKKLTPTISVDLGAKLSGEEGPTRREVEATVRRDQAHGVSAHLATEPREKE
jgi:hypothetical protein